MTTTVDSNPATTVPAVPTSTLVTDVCPTLMS